MSPERARRFFERPTFAATVGVLATFSIGCATPKPVTGPTPHRVDLPAARALISRVVPGRGNDFVVASIPDSAGLDVFEVASQGKKVVLRGSSGVAIASALDWYLEHVAGVNVDPPRQAGHPPHPAAGACHGRSTSRRRYRLRYFFNYCTFSYSMAWYDWNDWQRDDRLAGDEGRQCTARGDG